MVAIHNRKLSSKGLQCITLFLMTVNVAKGDTVDLDTQFQFVEDHYTGTVYENHPIGDKVYGVQLRVKGALENDTIRYVIDRSSDKKRQFNISRNGVVRIQRELDREVTPRHHVKILAIDDGTPPKIATTTLTVFVRDINDNAPTFLHDYRPVIVENKAPQEIVQILATDKDARSMSNGPPYFFQMDEHAPQSIKELFKVENDPRGDGGNGIAIVKSSHVFDREYQKEYLVPIIIKDSGRPSLSATSTLTITIGDVNDNRMFPGSKEIFVYSYRGMTPSTRIGRVNVDDMDDWNFNYKGFSWRSERHPNFLLDQYTGMITMLNGTQSGRYSLKFNVTDWVFMRMVSANVKVTVQEISEEAVFSSGSIRIHGTSAEDFIRKYDSIRRHEYKSKYEKFRELIARLVKTDVQNVDIFTVLSRQERPPITDIRYSVHGSPKYKPSFLDGIVALNREQIQKEVGINITMVKIDECVNFACETSCTNELVVDNLPKMVNANRTSLVGVNAYIRPMCVCGAREANIPKKCSDLPYKNPCLNGGRCMETISGVRCDRCPPGFNGPMCEQTTRSFNGYGYAWFPSLEQCSDSHFSLEFITRHSSGLIMYNGPIAEPKKDEMNIQDFISLELKEGKPLLLLDFGSGTLELIVDVKLLLNDEQWHRIDIYWTKDTARIVVDHCINADDTAAPSIFGRSHCEATGTIPPFNEFLNVNGPLQIGGVAHGPLTYNWNHRHTRARFNGCIKNVIHNSKLYDLASPGRAVHSEQGCPKIDDKCQLNGCTKAPYCLNGYCLATFSSRKCICKPRWRGDRCNYRDNQTDVGIGDKNDNTPYFDQSLYQAEVNEDADIQHTVITVTAHDKDESACLRYEITRGNVGGAFAVKKETGAIYVATPLDYETRKRYTLTLVASDNLNESETLVVVHIKDANDLPPVFYRPFFETTILEEDERRLPKRILEVMASDGDRGRPQNIVYFLTGQGINENDKDKSNFAINSTSGEIYVLKPLDRDLPNGKPQWRFKVLAKDEGGNGMVNYAEVFVNLKDINDNNPLFPSAVYNGYVTENSPKGFVGLTMTAVDYDDPNEGTNVQLKYTIAQSPMNDAGQRIFEINPMTGVIKTTVCCLDRETTPEYIIKVVAEDGGGLKGTGTATIKVNDVNDMPPEFTKDNWVAEVNETEGDKIPSAPILIVSVNDKDLLETNRFSYKVMNTSVGADRFTMVTNSDGTGSLKVAKPLDYEDSSQMYGFNITIQVTDKGGEHDYIDTAKVKIKLLDINDNKPEFDRAEMEIPASEDSELGRTLATFRARDADQLGMSQVRYAIDRSSDKKRQFNISRNGVVRIQRKLDREVTRRYHVKILAIDDGTPPKTATATLTVIVLDINDNAPTFLHDYRPVIVENKAPHEIVQILASDKDDRYKSNGPPYTFRMDEHAPQSIKELFKVEHDPWDYGFNWGNGKAIVKSSHVFDREYQKEYLVPIIIKDSGRPILSATSTLTITIGDVNDNRMFPGSKDIIVYSYRGLTPSAKIGRVNVDDMDDWDLDDKRFFWRYGHHPNFLLDESTGMITILNGTQSGRYFLIFTVTDRVWYPQEVSANVTVTVQEISEEAVFSSGSIRIHGTSAEDFIRKYDSIRRHEYKSKYEKFRELIARLVKTDVQNVDIFTVLSRQERPPITDIRYSVHGSPQYKPSFLDGIVAMNREQIEKEVGINITMIKIDECMSENVGCETRCTNELVVDNSPKMINANRTSLVGVNAYTRFTCVGV